jgi:hypothetical protein
VIVEPRRFERVATGKASIAKPSAQAAEATSRIRTGLRTMIGMTFIACLPLALPPLLGTEANSD